MLMISSLGSCKEVVGVMKLMGFDESRFQIKFNGKSSLFFLGLQVKQKPDGIFISQDKYVAEILKKFHFASVKTASTPIETQKPLVKDEEAIELVLVSCNSKGFLSLKCCERIFSDYAGANLDRKSTTGEAEYVAAASCYGKWLLDSKSNVYHSKTKHIAIRHHFIRDAYEKKLIQVLKIHTNDNVADLLTKAFDVSRFQFLVASIGMINP
ncbi:hypothetical protein Tco_0168610 [Tanacetum coccineum]